MKNEIPTMYRFVTDAGDEKRCFLVRKDSHDKVIGYSMSKMYDGHVGFINESFSVLIVFDRVLEIQQILMAEFDIGDVRIESAPNPPDQLRQFGGWWNVGDISWDEFKFDSVLDDIFLL